MPSASMSTMRACGANPLLRPAEYFRVLALTIPAGHRRNEAADSPRIAQQLAFNAQAFLAVFVDDEPRPALAEFGIHVLVPQIERLAGCGRLRRPRLRRPSSTIAPYFAAAGNAGSLPMSRMSCWMTTVAFTFATICFMRSIEATVAARSKLKCGTPPLS